MNMQQYKVNLKLNILKEVTACTYDPAFKDLIVNAVLESMFYTNNPTQSRMTKKTYGKDTIIMALIIMKCPYKDRVYDVPVNVFFMKNMPYEPPQFFIDLPMGKAINPKNSQIDPNSRKIMTMGLFKWTPTSEVISVLNEIQESFNRQFPIVNVNHNKMASSIMSNTANSNVSNAFQPRMNTNQPKDDWMIVSGKAITPNEVIQAKDKPNSAEQSLFPPEKADEFLKQVLQSEILEKVEGRLKEERNKKIQQKDRLQTYQKLFLIEEKKVMNYLHNQSTIQQMTSRKFQDINLEISNIRKYLAQNGAKTLSDNLLDYISIGKGSNERILSLIAQEAMYEEMLSISKKAFERQSNEFIDTIKFIRAESRILFKVKFAREKMLQMKYTTFSN